MTGQPGKRVRVLPQKWMCVSIYGFRFIAHLSWRLEWAIVKLDYKQGLDVLNQVCVFRADQNTKMSALASDRQRHFRLLLWNRFKGIQRNLTGSKISTFEFPADRKTTWPPWPLICSVIFDFSSKTAEWNSTKFDGKQDLYILYQVCVFRADRKNKTAALTSDWLSHFRLLWNRWTELNENWQEVRSQRSVQSLCFSGWSEKQKWPPWPLIGWDIFDFSPETAERNSTKIVRKQDLNVLYQVCVFGPIGRTRWPPWPLIGRDIFDFSSETTERNSTKFDRKQDLNVNYRVLYYSGWLEKQDG